MGRTDLNILLLIMVRATSQQGLMVRDLITSRNKGVSSFQASARTKSKWLGNGKRLLSSDPSCGPSHRPVETNHEQQKGLLNNISKRVQIGISKFSTIFRNQGKGCEGYPKFRKRKFATKSSNITCTFCSTTRRFLQYLFPGSEKVGRPAGCDKFETPQSVSQNSTFQDGYSEDCSKSSQERDWAISKDFKDAYFHV